MALDHVKSTFITNLDASPSVQNTAGEGGPAPLKLVDGWATGVASSNIDSTYQFVRIPSNAKVKQLVFETESQTVGVGDLGLYYATDGEGKQPTALLAAAAIDRDFFASLYSLVSVTTPVDVTNESTTYTVDKRAQPIWQAVGLTSDPGGYFDIVLTLSTAITTGTGKMGLKCFYTD